jgi:peroxiredoxin
MKSKILLVSLIIIGVGIIVLLQTKDTSFNRPGIFTSNKVLPAPNITLPSLDGKMVSLTDFKGKVVLLNIWATWCAPCVEEMPSMEKLHQELKDEGFKILAVSIDESGAGVVRPFMERHRLSFTALLDTKGTTKNTYRITGVPESFIIDQQGNIIEKVIGARDWASSEIIGYFRNLLKRK